MRDPLATGPPAFGFLSLGLLALPDLEAGMITNIVVFLSVLIITEVEHTSPILAIRPPS